MEEAMENAYRTALIEQINSLIEKATVEQLRVLLAATAGYIGW